MCHIAHGIDEPAAFGVQRVEERPERPGEGGLVGVTRGEQVIGRSAKHDFVVDRDLEHLVVKIRLTARYRVIGQVRIVDGEITTADGMYSVSAGTQQPRTLHLQANAEAVAGNAGNIGFRAVDPVRGSAHFAYDGACDRARLKRPAEGLAAIRRKLDGYAKQAFAAHFAPLVEAVLGLKILGCETDDGVRGLLPR